VRNLISKEVTESLVAQENTGEKRKRYDYVLQEKGIESYIKPVGLLKSHTDYFENKDVAYFVLRKIHKKKIRLDL
jgi:DDHD domain